MGGPNVPQPIDAGHLGEVRGSLMGQGGANASFFEMSVYSNQCHESNKPGFYAKEIMLLLLCVVLGLCVKLCVQVVWHVLVETNESA